MSYNCTNCYDTGNATAYLADFRGRMVIHTEGFQTCEECQIVLPRTLLHDVLRELIQREYDAERYSIFMESCGYKDQDAIAYKQVAVDTHAQIDKLEARVGIKIDRSFISDKTPEHDVD